jgi:hypothetical protein
MYCEENMCSRLEEHIYALTSLLNADIPDDFESSSLLLIKVFSEQCSAYVAEIGVLLFRARNGSCIRFFIIEGGRPLASCRKICMYIMSKNPP